MGGEDGEEVEYVDGEDTETDGVGVEPDFAVVGAYDLEVIKHEVVEAIYVQPDPYRVRLSFSMVSVGGQCGSPVSAALVDVEGVDVGACFF